MKGIGAFVLVLLVTLGVVGYFVTRPPSRELDLQEHAWVQGFGSWRDAAARDVDRATAGLSFASKARNARLLEPLRTCTRSFRRLGRTPVLFESVQRASLGACAEAEHAVGLNDRFDVSSLASTKFHLNQAGDLLGLAARNLRVDLGETS